MKVHNVPVKLASIGDLRTALIKLYGEAASREMVSLGTLLKEISAQRANMTKEEKHSVTVQKVRELEK